jgi:hypothetical protein
MELSFSRLEKVTSSDFHVESGGCEIAPPKIAQLLLEEVNDRSTRSLNASSRPMLVSMVIHSGTIHHRHFLDLILLADSDSDARTLFYDSMEWERPDRGVSLGR